MNNKTLLATMTCVSALAVTSRADDLTATTSNDDAWKFALNIPGWFAGINGNTTIRGRQRDVNVNFDQIWDHLQSSYALDFTAQKGKWGFIANATYMKLTANPSGQDGFITSDATLNFFVGDADVTYQLVKTEGDHPLIVNAIAGLRYWYVGSTIAVRDQHGNQVGGSAYFNVPDPILGFRATQYLCEKLHLDVQLDGGGFNINNDTDWTWGAAGSLAYDFTTWFTLSAGYQALAIDESTGSGDSKKGANLILNGAVVDLTFKF
jgi:hypothetical protein